MFYGIPEEDTLVCDICDRLHECTQIEDGMCPDCTEKTIVTNKIT